MASVGCERVTLLRTVALRFTAVALRFVADGLRFATVLVTRFAFLVRFALLTRFAVWPAVRARAFFVFAFVLFIFAV
jgi:hypothetical protein